MFARIPLPPQIVTVQVPAGGVYRQGHFQQGLAVGPHRCELFDASETMAPTGGQDYDIHFSSTCLTKIDITD